MSHLKQVLRTAAAVICIISVLLIPCFSIRTAYASSGYGFVLLNAYSRTMKIGDEFYLAAVTSNGKKPSFSSDNSKVASVNTYGRITAKKAGTAFITAKIKNGEARCKITVKKTTIKLSASKISLENGETARLKASVSTGHPAVYQSSRSGIASVDESGRILAKKPGTALITVTADKTSVSCKVTVKYPKVKISKSFVSLYRKKTVRLSVSSSSKSTPKWKTSRKSIATVDHRGVVTAVKNGTALITVTVDGVSRTCQVLVKKPEIRFAKNKVILKIGKTCQAGATVSSGNRPEYSSSNTGVASVDENGTIRARAAGRAYIYAKEDGAKERMEVVVKAK